MNRLLRSDVRPMMRRCNECIRSLAEGNFDFLSSIPTRAEDARNTDA